MTGSFKIARVVGIEIEVHYTWLFALALITWSLAQGFFPTAFPTFDPITDWVLGFVSALLLFASVLIHELSHSFVAMKRGLVVSGITLFIFGGVSRIAGEPRGPKDEFAMSVAGPLTSFALAGCFWLLGQVLGPAETPGAAVTWYLAFVNLALGVFNLVPGFPLDGGRVLRSIVWGATHNFRRATQVATVVGQIFGFLLIGWGMVRRVRRGRSVPLAVWTRGAPQPGAALLCRDRSYDSGSDSHELPGHQRHRRPVLVVGHQRCAGGAVAGAHPPGRQQPRSHGPTRERTGAECPGRARRCTHERGRGGPVHWLGVGHMKVGDTVIVKDTGRRALITAELPDDHFQVEFLPDPAEDPIDRDSAISADEGGVYFRTNLEPLTLHSHVLMEKD
jgi:Zn-dependent protease